MKISIITVTYNSERYVHHCISSVLAQLYEDVEYIIVDGGSTDSTLDIIKSFPDLKYISEPDEGIYDAINKGIKLATGDIVGLLNSDDFFADNNVLNRIAEEFKSDTQLEAVYADVLFVHGTDISKSIRYYSSKKFRPWMFRYGFQPAHPTFYVKRELFSRLGYYRTDLKIAGDFELLLRFISAYKVKYKYVRDLWVKMRIGGASSSGIKSVLKLNSEIIISCNGNQIYTNSVMIYSKYLLKWYGFIHKGRSRKEGIDTSKS